MKNKLIALLIGLLFTAGLVAWWMAPNVESVDPLPAAGPLQGKQALKITFTRPMQAEGVEERLALQPPQASEVTWNQSRTALTLTPHQLWPSGETLTLTLDSGAKSQRGLPLLRSHAWEFEISPAHLIYLWPADGDSNLYTLNMETGNNQALTTYPYGVLDFDISADGSKIYYSVWHSSEESAIYVFDRRTRETLPLLNCSLALCRSPKISPTGQFMAYERIPQAADIDPSIHIYNIENQLTSSVSESGHFAENPLWSSEGWLAFYDHTAQAFLFTNPSDGETVTFPNETGGSGSWSLMGDTFLATEIFLAGTGTASRHLLEFSLGTGLKRDFTPKNYLEDVNPVYSPDGDQIAFERKCLVASCWTPGRQLWVMSSDGEHARPLTDAPDYNHTKVVWHPNGQLLAYVRYNNAKLSEAPEIWTITRSGEENTRLVINGYSPRWLP
ncbi:MAG: Protein TolB [Chloroflexi bacterium]|nr:Protein TolB [Chloroflexota bacterium]